MRGEEQPERLLLHQVEFLLVVLDPRNRRVLWCGKWRGHTIGANRLRRFLEVEDRPLPEQRVLLGLLTRALSVRKHREHPPAGVPGRVERPAADQGLDRLLVHRTAVD